MQLRTPAPKRTGGALPGSNNGGGAKPGSVRPAGSGRQPGTPNKVTLTAKLAIAEFVDGNANKVYITRPNPERAFNLFQSVVEYHVPKLARSEISGPGGGVIPIAAVDLKGLSDVELDTMQRLMSKAAGQ